MKLTYLKEDALSELKSAVEKHVDGYKDGSLNVEDIYQYNWKMETSRLIPEINLVYSESQEPYESDAENAIIIHKALKELKPYEATDERLWTYLTHVHCWEYMLYRWPVEKYISQGGENVNQYIKERYFISATN